VLGGDDPRVARAVFTLRETAGYLDVPKSTIHEWARPPRRQAPLITCFPSRGRQATVPFIGFAEGYVLSAFRRAGVPLQRIRPAVQALESTIGIEHALASRSLYTDGAEVLYDFAEREADDLLELQLVVVRTGQHQFSEVVRDYLQRITYGEDGWASRSSGGSGRPEHRVRAAACGSRGRSCRGPRRPLRRGRQRRGDR
jgi:hypothetical protein